MPTTDEVRPDRSPAPGSGDADFIGWRDPAPHAARGPGIVSSHTHQISSCATLSAAPQPSASGSGDAVREALVEVVACFDAAYAEGLTDALNDCREDYDHGGARLVDLVERRLWFAHTAAMSALSAVDPEPMSDAAVRKAARDILNRFEPPRYAPNSDPLLGEGTCTIPRRLLFNLRTALSATDPAPDVGALQARVAELAEALRPFAIVGASEACAPHPHPRREERRASNVLWSYSRGDDDRLEITTEHVRGAAAALSYRSAHDAVRAAALEEAAKIAEACSWTAYPGDVAREIRTTALSSRSAREIGAEDPAPRQSAVAVEGEA